MAESRMIGAHLSVCEFCEAEVDFYGHYPPVEEIVMPEKIPTPLFELAEALLGTHHSSSVSKLSREIDRLHADEH